MTTAAQDKNLFSFAKELIKRDYLLSKTVKKYKPDVLGAIGGTFIAHAGFITKTPSIVFYDTENAKLQNLITYKFASVVITPMCYESWLPKNNIKYSGYHELSYLDPRYFSPDKGLAISNGLDPSKDNFFIRLVSWNANHDIGEKGITTKTLDKMLHKLSSYGNVIISSESELPPHIDVLNLKVRFTMFIMFYLNAKPILVKVQQWLQRPFLSAYHQFMLRTQAGATLMSKKVNIRY